MKELKLSYELENDAKGHTLLYVTHIRAGVSMGKANAINMGFSMAWAHGSHGLARMGRAKSR